MVKIGIGLGNKKPQLGDKLIKQSEVSNLSKGSTATVVGGTVTNPTYKTITAGKPPRVLGGGSPSNTTTTAPVQSPETQGTMTGYNPATGVQESVLNKSSTTTPSMKLPSPIQRQYDAIKQAQDNALLQQQRGIEINPTTGKPYGTISKSKSYWEQSGDYWSKLKEEKGFFGAIVPFVGNQVFGWSEKSQIADYRAGAPNALVMGAERSNLLQFGTESLIYATPIVGSGILAGSGTETLTTPSGWKRIGEQSESLQSQGVNPIIATGISISEPVVNLGLGYAGLKGTYDFAKAGRESTLWVESQPSKIQEFNFKTGESSGISISSQTKQAFPTFVDKYGYGIKPQTGETFIISPYTTTPSGTTFFEGGKGLSVYYQGSAPKTFSFTEFNVGGISKATGGSPRLVNNQVSRELFNFESQAGRMNIKPTSQYTISKQTSVSFPSGKATTTFNIQTTKPSISQKFNFIGGTAKINDKASIFFVGEPTQVKSNILFDTKTYRGKVTGRGASLNIDLTRLGETSTKGFSVFTGGGKSTSSYFSTNSVVQDISPSKVFAGATASKTLSSDFIIVKPTQEFSFAKSIATTTTPTYSNTQVKEKTSSIPISSQITLPSVKEDTKSTFAFSSSLIQLPKTSTASSITPALASSIVVIPRESSLTEQSQSSVNIPPSYYNPQPTPPTSLTPFAIPPFPSFDFGSQGNKIFKGKQKLRYVPDFKSLFFNIKGKAPKKISSFFGYGEQARPILGRSKAPKKIGFFKRIDNRIKNNFKLKAKNFIKRIGRRR